MASYIQIGDSMVEIEYVAAFFVTGVSLGAFPPPAGTHLLVLTTFLLVLVIGVGFDMFVIVALM